MLKELRNGVKYLDLSGKAQKLPPAICYCFHLQLKLLFQTSRVWEKHVLEKGMFMSQVMAASWCWEIFSETFPEILGRSIDLNPSLEAAFSHQTLL